MKRTLFALVTLAVLVVPRATLQAQDLIDDQHQIDFWIAGGRTNAERDFARLSDGGYHLTGVVTYAEPFTRQGFRGEVSYSEFDHKPQFGSGRIRILSATWNMVLQRVGSTMGPYFIFGGGIYNATSVCSGCTAKATKGGANAGGGFRFSVAGVAAFVEARYHNIPGAMDPTTAGIKSGTTFIPISLGVKF